MEFIIHFIVPFTILTLIGLNVRRAFIISLFALLPDVDALFLVHRSLTHSLVVLMAVAVPLLLLIRKFKPKLQGYGLMASLSAASHLAFDIVSGFTPILWPLYGYSIWVKTDLIVHIGGLLTLTLNVNLLTEPINFHHYQRFDAPIFTGEGLILSIALLSSILLRTLKDRRQRRAY